MRVKITFTEIDGYPSVEIDIPDNCSSIKYAEQRRDASGKDGWDALTEFEQGIAECLADGIEVNILPIGGVR